MTRIFNFRKNLLSAVFVLPIAILSGCQEKESPAITELKLESATLNVPSEGGDAVMSYTVTNPIEGAEVSAGSEAGWLHDFDCSTEGIIRFVVDENPEVGKTRTATVTVIYNDGAIEDEFTVLQGEGLEKAPFEITVDEVGMDYAIATIAPQDHEMTWYALTYETWYFDEKTVEDAVSEFINAMSFVAGMAQMDLETFMSTSVLVTGTQTVQFDRLGICTEQLIMAIGLAPDGSMLSDAVFEPFTTMDIENIIDVTFEISCDIEGPNVTLNTIPSNNNVRYYTDIKLKSDWPDGPDLQAWIQTLIWRGSISGKSREQVVEEISSYGKVDKEYYLNANTEYYAFAAAINEEGIVNSEVYAVEFTSGDILMSDNTFEVTVTEVGTDYVDIHILPSDSDNYTWAVIPAAEWTGDSDEEFIDWYIQSNSFFLDLRSNISEQTVRMNNLAPETEYYACVFGYEQMTRTTDVTKVHFTTTAADNPENLTFEFEVSDIKGKSIDVKVTGTPAQALYYWDVIDASATEEVAKETLEARVQRWIDIGYMPDRASVFQQKGVRGSVQSDDLSSYNFGYNSIEPGKEYKLYAVGIYDETGEYATDFFFSEPFTTPAN